MPKTNASKLNSKQTAVLEAVASGPKETSNVTKGDVVSGIASKALEGVGYVTITRRPKGGKTSVQVKITPAGRKYLKDKAKEAAKLAKAA